MDWFVVFTPLTVLALILLLGFAGCDKLFGLEEITPLLSLVLQAKVPTTITVDKASLTWRRPGSTTQETATMLSAGDDGAGNAVFSFPISSPTSGTWAVGCRLDVHEGAALATDTGSGMFTLDVTTMPNSDAVFGTQGDPSTTFKVVFLGIMAE
jgi:hypothetical protein